MLKLVADNTNKNVENETRDNRTLLKTCETSCVLFNHEKNVCPMFKGLNYEDPNVVKRCMEFTDIKQTEALYHEDEHRNTVVTLIEDEYSVETDMDFLFELMGKKDSEKESKYPVKADMEFDKTMEGLFWFVSPDRKFGCWIKNNKLFGAIPGSREKAEKGWKENIYRSPIPLHDHVASESLKTRMCWFVDDDGWGQYTVIVANKIKFITFPKPNTWK